MNVTDTPFAAAFDDDYTLADLISTTLRQPLADTLDELLAAPCRIVDEQGTVLVGDCDPVRQRAALHLDIEAIGYLESASIEAIPPGIVRLIEMQLRAASRYQMAASLHLATARADFDALQDKHAALQQSEARYRELTASLEHRVSEEVAENDRVRRQLYANEKLAAVGQLAAGVAHEINNPIGFVRSNLHTARGYLQTFNEFIARARQQPELEQLARDSDFDFVLEDFQQILEESSDGIDRVARIVADLKDFSRVDSVGSEQLTIKHMVNSACNMLNSRLPAGVSLELELAEAGIVQCEAAKLVHALYSLLDNALLAVADEGCIHVATGRTNDQGWIRVRDTGPGMSEETCRRALEPFFTTRPVGAGTGLGLTVVNDVVTALDGRLEITSVPGQGTTVTIQLPIINS